MFSEVILAHLRAVIFATYLSILHLFYMDVYLKFQFHILLYRFLFWENSHNFYYSMTKVKPGGGSEPLSWRTVSGMGSTLEYLLTTLSLFKNERNFRGLYC